MKISAYIWVFLSVFLLNCGRSQFSSYLKSHPDEEASKALEQNDSVSAITTMLNALGSDFKQIFVAVTPTSDMAQVQQELQAELTSLMLTKDPYTIANYVSILASAQAQLYQIDPLSIILKFIKDGSGSSSSTTSSSSGELLKLFPVLPDATAANLQGASLAITLMNSYDASLLTAADKFKLAIFLTAYLALILKSLDVNNNGVIDAVEILNMSQTTAASFLGVLHQAATTFLESNSGSSDTARSSQAGQKIADIESAIQASQGSTDTDKLKDYLSKR